MLGLGAAAPLAVSFPAAAPARAVELRSRLGAVLGRMPARPHARFDVLENRKIEGGTRLKIEYLAEPAAPTLRTPDDRIRAYLLVPDHAPGQRLPAIVAIHQDGPQSHIGKAEPAGLAGDSSLFYGLDLFRRGYVVICPDRFEHAERRRVQPNDLTSVDPARDDMLVEHWAGQLLLEGRTAFGKEAYDLMVATDILASLPSVDPRRIGAIGHSAGGNALVYLMFCDPRIRCGVSSCGLFSLESFFAEDAPKRRMTAFALPGLLEVGRTADYLAFVAPRPMLLTRGLWEWGQGEREKAFSLAHVDDTRAMVAHARQRYAAAGAANRLEALYFDEDGGGHAFPAGVKAHAYRWLDAALARSGPRGTG